MRPLSKCKTGKQLVNYAEQCGADVSPGKGSHFKVRTDKGIAMVPVHGNKQLPTGTHRSVLKMFAAIGLIGFVGACVLLNWMCAAGMIQP